MKEWAKKNLWSLISVIAATAFALLVIVTIFGIGLGAKQGGSVIKYGNVGLEELHKSVNSMISAALALACIAIVPVVIRLILGILGIDAFARLFNSASIGLALISVILLITGNITLLSADGVKVAVGSIIGFYVVIILGFLVLTGPIVRK
ncbi:hypothetical protein [Mesoplasma coleopterae]|uniref:Uncharacterized protein n=1 Tax=Mesoplasma coleopterae TaxID=324078 RepID=A0A2K8P1R4_9MOLU|nr:hypothetical protein [Mesoplasma coleopterae]ATZ20692.1 hypothetical protein MCOLE_v1c01770 [Mesoplasma coleopterae]AVN62209.1 hypothetical protein CG001_00850 [Mesoplasma coleopterae]AVN62874.1 hypothetical protein CG000_00905 [Mesoplasma coleopterae]